MAQRTDTAGAIQVLKKELKENNLGRLYIFFGEESFLLHYYLEQIKKALIDELTESFNYHKLTTENFSVQRFADAVENMPMMAEHTFVWVDEVDPFKLPEDDRNKLTDIFSDIPEYCTVVFTFEMTAWKPDKRMQKLWNSIRTAGVEVAFNKQDHRDLIAWITRHFAAAKKRITPDLCTYLIDITGGTMTALSGEISKICAYSGSEQITKSDIDAVVEPVLDAVVFQMTDLMGQGQYGPALLKLRQLFKMQQEPLSILGAIGKHFRNISMARILIDNGKTVGDMMQLCSMKEYPAQKAIAAARKFSARFCKVAAELVMETDNAMKTSYDDPLRLLEVLVLRLAQEAKNG